MTRTKAAKSLQQFSAKATDEAKFTHFLIGDFFVKALLTLGIILSGLWGSAVQAHICEGNYTRASYDDSKSSTRNDIKVRDEDGELVTMYEIAYCQRNVSVKLVEVGTLGHALVRFSDSTLTKESDLNAVGSDSSKLFSIYNPGADVLAADVNTSFMVSTGEKNDESGTLNQTGGSATSTKSHLVFGVINKTDEVLSAKTKCSEDQMIVEVTYNGDSVTCVYGRKL